MPKKYKTLLTNTSKKCIISCNLIAAATDGFCELTQGNSLQTIADRLGSSILQKSTRQNCPFQF